MEILVFLSGLIVALIGSAVGGFIAVMVVQGYGYANLAGKMQRIENKMASGLGIEVKAEKASRLQEAMVKVMAVMKDENVPKEEKSKALMSVAAEYPDVALDLVKKVGIKGLF